MSPGATTPPGGGHRVCLLCSLCPSLLFCLSLSPATVCMCISVKFKGCTGFLHLLCSTCGGDVRMQMCWSLTDDHIYMEDHSEAQQTCHLCLKKRGCAERNHVKNNTRDVKFHLLHAWLLTANAFCLKTFTKQTN